MKLMIASDLHGSAQYTQKLLQAYHQEGAERLLLLGDLLYHGARNDLPPGYATMGVAEQLNQVAEQILCVRGNCDSEVDQMVLDFSLEAEQLLLWEQGTLIYATHGHHYSEAAPPKLPPGSVLLTGHTHVPRCAEHSYFTYLNPGSVSIPKGGSAHSYLLLDAGVFYWKELLTGEVYRSWALPQRQQN